MKRLRVSVLLVCTLVSSVQAQYSLTVLHNNDGESALVGNEASGGIARFATLVDQSRTYFEGAGHGVVTIYAGDSFLPSPEFQASLNSGSPGSRTFYDARALSQIGYDAAAIGNHEFDAGPSVLAEFVADAQTSNPLPFLSSNLDFSGEASLNSLVGSAILPSTTVSVNTAAGEKTVGVIGATTENLPFLTTTGAVTVGDVAAGVNAQIDALRDMTDHLILVSHLQGISEDIALLPNLSPGLDLVVAGGGDEILADLAAAANPAGAPASVSTAGLLGGDTVTQPAYPNLVGMDSAGNVIPVVTGAGDYKYLGRVTMNFDAAGNLTGYDAASNPLPNLGSLTPNAELVNAVETPVKSFVDGLAVTKLATSSQLLVGNGNRDVIRAKEAGLGNLIADAFLANAQDVAGELGVATPAFAIANGGGIRDDIEVGDITLATTFDISPFGNVLTVVEDIAREDIAMMFENAYSRTVDGDAGPGIDPVRANVDGTGRFLHVSDGVEIVYNIEATALELGSDGSILTEGERIETILINGEAIVVGGEVVPGDPLDMVVVDFLASGGDQTFGSHLSQEYGFTRLGLTDQNAIANYLESISGGDAGFDIAADTRYDSAFDGRITATPEPSSMLLMALALSAFILPCSRSVRSSKHHIGL